MSDEKKNGFPSPADSRQPPQGFDPSKLPKDFDPSKMPKGFDPSKGPPKGFDPSKMPKDLDPDKMKEMMEKGEFPEGMPQPKGLMKLLMPKFDPNEVDKSDLNAYPPGYRPLVRPDTSKKKNEGRRGPPGGGPPGRGMRGEKPKDFKFLYGLDLPVKEKIETVAKKIYGADGVVYSAAAEKAIANMEAKGYGGLPVCIAKTQASLTDDSKRKGAPKGWKLNVREVWLSAGAGFIVPVCGTLTLMPGLPKVPAAMRMDLKDDGTIVGLK